MKKLFTCLAFIIVLFGEINAQVPQAFNFQGIARDTAGMPIASETFEVSIEILNSTGSPEFSELDTIVTNPSGVFSLQIGKSNPTDFSAIPWLEDSYSVRISIDPDDDGIFDILSPNVQLLSVPYALAADKAAELEGFPLSSTSATQDQILVWNGTQWVASDAPSGDGLEHVHDTYYGIEISHTNPVIGPNSTSFPYYPYYGGGREFVIKNIVEDHWHLGFEGGPVISPSPAWGQPTIVMSFKDGGYQSTSSSVGIGTFPTERHFGKLTIQADAIPMAFIDSDQNVQAGGAWRVFHNNGKLGFDVNTDPSGSEWTTSAGKRVLAMYHAGNVGRVGIGMISPDPQYELDVNGNVQANNYLASSDLRFKKDLQSLKNPLEKITALEGVSYLFRQDLDGEHNFSDRSQIGFIAQDLEEILPELVYQDDYGFYSINYMGVIPILVEAIKEQEVEKTQMQAETDQLKAEIAELRMLVNALSQKVDQDQQLSGTTAANH